TTLQSVMPGIGLELAIEHTRDPMKGLVSGEVDAALLTHAQVARGAGLSEFPLFADEMVFVVSEDHALSSRRALSRDDLLTHTLFSTTGVRGEMGWFLRQAFGRARPKLKGEQLPLTEAVLD